MKRLTKAHYNGKGYYMICSEDCNNPADCIDCAALDNLVERLAAYEDTGLAPEEIRDMAERNRMITAYDNDSEPYLLEATGTEAKRIVELLNAEVEGRLIILPCKLGDTVYIVGSKYRHGCIETWINTGKFCLADIAKLGDTVFVSLEEAQKAEAALKGGGGI